MAVAGSIQDVPCSSVSTAIKSHDVAREVQRKECRVKCNDGTSKPVKPKDFFKAEYKNEYTGKVLLEPEVHAALINELELAKDDDRDWLLPDVALTDGKLEQNAIFIDKPITYN